MQQISEFLGILILYLIIIVFLVCLPRLLLDPTSSPPIQDSHEHHLLLSKHAATLSRCTLPSTCSVALLWDSNFLMVSKGLFNKLRHVQTHCVFHLFHIITWRLRYLIVCLQRFTTSQKAQDEYLPNLFLNILILETDLDNIPFSLNSLLVFNSLWTFLRMVLFWSLFGYFLLLKPRPFPLVCEI